MKVLVTGSDGFLGKNLVVALRRLPRVDVLGFVGREAASTARALSFCGRGRALQWRDLAHAHVIVLAVPDPVLGEVVQTAAAAVPARSKLTA